MSTASPVSAIIRDYRDQPRWVEWRELNGQRVPFIAGTNSMASHSDPKQWRPYDRCRGDRRGFVFNGDGVGGIDLDACRDPDSGELTTWAQEIVDDFQSLTEISPSGTGVKVFARGAPTALPTNVIPMPGEPIRGKQPQLEAYITQRYFTVTGDRLAGTPDEIRDAPDAWTRLVERLRQQRSENRKQPAGRNAALVQFGGRLRRAGANDDDIRTQLTAANSRDGGLHPNFIIEGPLPERELERCIQQVLKFPIGEQRVVIELHADEPHLAADAAEEVLAATDRVYRQDTALVRFTFERDDTSRGRPTAVARIRPYTLPLLERELAQLARCVKWKVTKKKAEQVRTNIPDRLIDMVLASASPKFSELVGVIETPTLRPDGSLLAQEGYDPVTGLMLVNLPPLPPIAEYPSRAEAEAALALLDRLLSEFPFVDAASRSVALSALITPVVRGALRHVPMHAVSAPEGGSGKGYLLNTASYIAIGRALAALGAGRLGRGSHINTEELDKRLVGAVLAGQSFIYLDNIGAVLGSDFLCQIITEPLVEVRRLGVTGNPRVRPVATVFATGNNLEIEGDLIRRTLQCRLDAEMEDPTAREFKQQPHQMVLARRGKYIAAALTLVRAHLVVGCPGVTLVPPYAGFDDWSRLVRSALVWLGRADPVGSQQELRVADPAAAALDTVMEAWALGLFGQGGERPQMVDKAYTTGELVDCNCGVLEAALREAVGARDLETGIKIKVGMFLKKSANRVRNGMKIVASLDKRLKRPRWQLAGWREFMVARTENEKRTTNGTVVTLPRSSVRKAARKPPD